MQASYLAEQAGQCQGVPLWSEVYSSPPSSLIDDNRNPLSPRYSPNYDILTTMSGPVKIRDALTRWADNRVELILQIFNFHSIRQVKFSTNTSWYRNDRSKVNDRHTVLFINRFKSNELIRKLDLNFSFYFRKSNSFTSRFRIRNV